jgi:hypothetical protein
VVLGTTVVVGSTKVVVGSTNVVEVVVGADEGATVEGTAVVDVGAEEVVEFEFVAIALASPFGALEQAAVPRPNATRAETVTNLNFCM